MNKKKASRPSSLLISLIGIALLYCGSAHAVQSIFDGPGSSYDDGANWSAGIPSGANEAIIGVPATPATVLYDNDLGGLHTTSGRMVIGWGNLANGSLTLGPNAGTLQFGDTGGDTYVGVDGGTGTLTLNGGSLETTTNLRIGVNTASANGTVTVNDGLLNVEGDILMSLSNSNVSALNISDGEVRMRRLEVGLANGGASSLALSGDGVLTTQGAIGDQRIFIGAGNGATTSAMFSIADNAVINSGNDFIVGFLSDASGTQTGGTINVTGGNYFVAPFAQGAMTQTGGDVIIHAGASEGLSIGTRLGGNGIYNLNGGTVELARLNVSAGGGTGVLNLGGGTLKMNNNFTTAYSLPLTGVGATPGIHNATIDTNGFSADFTGAFSGPGGLTKDGTGTMTLHAASSFTGNVAVNGGTLLAGTDPTLPGLVGSLGSISATRSLTVNNGGTLIFGDHDTFGTVNATPANITTIINEGGSVESRDSFTTLGPLQLNGGALVDNGGALASHAAFQLKGTVTVGGTAASTISQTGGSNNGIHLHANTTFNIGDTIAGDDLIVTANLRNAPGGGIGPTASLIKTGAGTMRLDVANSFSGDITVNGGTLRAGNGGALQGALGANGVGGRVVTVNNGGTLQFGAHDTFGDAGASTPDNFTMVINEGGTVESSDTFTTLGALQLNGGSLVDNGGANADYRAFQLRGPVTVTGTAASDISQGSGSNQGIHLRGNITFNVSDILAGNDLTVSAQLRGAAPGNGGSGLTKIGAGTMSLSGTNIYNGTTTVNAGTLLVDGTLANSNVIINPGGELGGTGTINGSITNNGMISPGSSPGMLSVGNMPGGLGLYGWEILDADTGLGAGIADTSWDLLITNDLNVNVGVDTILVQGLDGLPSDPGFPANLDISVVGNTTGPFEVLRVDGTLTGDLLDIIIAPGNLGQYGTFTKSLEGTTDTLFLTFTSTVPEPGTYALFALLALAGFYGIRRRTAK